ncbi:MAG TPA: alpha-amylase/4-alpha-glucanotransferase domain-containing protein, partial [Planctomycetaceae bacterium]|nr:alpha-amylase/4-alpha-glucanotransferase domain-containing protein [Planctomycetaceae bacterium]
MSSSVRLVLVFHNHQPIGNFEGVFEAAFQESYAPFLDVLREYPDIKVSIHNSGSLLEWLVAAHPEYVDGLRELSQSGQIEILGGPFYEPILACVPRRDRVGQIRLYSDYLETLFGKPVRGMWVPERVWEQSFASDIAEAGIEFTVLDDSHFRNAGLSPEKLFGHFITEDEGQVLSIFPIAERLRYTIPWEDPEASVEFLRGLAEKVPNAIAVCGDDGEKFGVWPGTHDLVFERGWLRRFFDALRDNRDWLKTTTLGECIDNVSPVGRCFLPDSSYREMTEWVLPPERQLTLAALKEKHEADADWSEIKQFMRGGFWRNFRVKYPEANEMYARASQVSSRLEELTRLDSRGQHRDKLAEARSELYRGQCNCPYWHGSFGGLYLPHLRNAIYQHLIAADNLLEEVAGKLGSANHPGSGHWVRIDSYDFDFDAHQEIQLASDRLVAYLAPAHGGHLYELDLRSIRHNLLATLDRRFEPYHEKIKQAALDMSLQSGTGGVDPTGGVKFKQPDLDKKLNYDLLPRKSFVDHILAPETTFEDFQLGKGEIGDFVTGAYQSVLRRSSERVEAVLSRVGRVGHHEIKLTKRVALNARGGTALEVLYVLEDLPKHEPLHFGIELNFAGMAADADDRYFYDDFGRRLGQLQTSLNLPETTRLGLVDEWLGLDVAVELSQPAALWAFPIQTVSNSEGGFETVHQSCSVMPHWRVKTADGRWSVQLTLSIDTSAAQARLLA